MSFGADVLVVSLGTTLGWRIIDTRFLGQLERAGVRAEAVTVRMGTADLLRRGYPLNDLVEMHASRRSTRTAVARTRPRAVIFSTTTAAMLAPPLDVPYAVRLDAPASVNRPGARNALVRSLERRSLGRARIVLPMSHAARDALPPTAARSVVVPTPIDASGPSTDAEARLAVAYVPDPKAKGLDIVARGWAAAGVADARLEVYGLDANLARAHLSRCGLAEPEGMTLRGIVPEHAFRARMRAARVYVGGARWEDFGQAPLEALADGALLATVSSGGPFEALRLAREVGPELVAPGLDPGALGAAIRAAFAMRDERVQAYRVRAGELLGPFRSEAVQATVANEVLPALLGASPPWGGQTPRSGGVRPPTLTVGGPTPDPDRGGSDPFVAPVLP